MPPFPGPEGPSTAPPQMPPLHRQSPPVHRTSPEMPTMPGLPATKTTPSHLSAISKQSAANLEMQRGGDRMGGGVSDRYRTGGPVGGPMGGPQGHPQQLRYQPGAHRDQVQQVMTRYASTLCLSSRYTSHSLCALSFTLGLAIPLIHSGPRYTSHLLWASLYLSFTLGLAMPCHLLCALLFTLGLAVPCHSLWASLCLVIHSVPCHSLWASLYLSFTLCLAMPCHSLWVSLCLVIHSVPRCALSFTLGLSFTLCLAMPCHSLWASLCVCLRRCDKGGCSPGRWEQYHLRTSKAAQCLNI